MGVFEKLGEMISHLLIYFIEEKNGVVEVFAFAHCIWFYP